MTRSRFQSTEISLCTTHESIEHLVNCGGVLSSALVEAREAVATGVTPEAISNIVEQVIRDHGACPILKGFAVQGSPVFPAAATVSVNEIAVNGVPGRMELSEYDAITIDASCELNGTVTDAATTVVIGGGASGLTRAARRVYEAAVGAVGPGLPISGIAEAAMAEARALGYDLADEALAHGLGRSLHSAPAVYWDRVEPAACEVFLPGMVLAIEPVVVEPTLEGPGLVVRCRTEPDGWSRRAPARAAYEERTVLVTETGLREITPIPAY